MTISIIVPAYNAERYIDRCVASIYKDSPDEEMFEVIAINDGSTDNTLKLLEAYSNQHKNLVVIDRQNNGVSVARNVGIDTAKGEYVLFLDVDDQLVDGALEKVCDYLTGLEQIDMLVTRQIRKNSEKEWIVDAPSLRELKRYSGLEAYRCNYIRTNAGGGICRTVFLRRHGIRFPEGVKNAEDTVFFGQFQVYADSIVYINIPLYIINETDGSASRDTDFTKLGRSHAVTMRSVVAVKESLDGNREQKAIFDYVVYQLLANTISYYVASKELTYRQLWNDVDIKKLFPLDTKYMYQMRNEAKIMNLNLSLFYFLSWIKHHGDK